MKRIPLPFLSSTQQDLRSGIKDLLDREHTTPGADPQGPETTRLWTALADLGVGGILVPEPLDGLGLGAVEYCLLGLELGWHAVSRPVLETVAVGGLLARHGREPESGRWLTGLLAGRTRFTVTTPDVPFAVDADVVDAILCAGAGTAYLVPVGDCELRRLRSMDDNRRIFRVDHPRRAADVLSTDDAALTHLDGLTGLATAALLTGLGARMFSDACDYASVREQFGRPIGSFQAVAHKLAGCDVLVERAVVTTLRAAQEFDRYGSDVAVSVARSIAGDTARRLSIDVLQTFGGIGFTAEHHLGHWLKLAKALESTSGTVRSHRDRIADAWFAGSPLLHGGSESINERARADART